MTIDVTDILNDPDFVTCGLIRVRQAETVGDNGMAEYSEEEIEFSGVLSQSDEKMDRDSDGSKIPRSFIVTTTTELIEGDENCNSDIVIYKSRRFTVKTVRDNSNWGAGFYRAYCEAISYV